jgi:hypothetical protein
MAVMDFSGKVSHFADIYKKSASQGFAWIADNNKFYHFSKR